ncbi:MAG: glycosyl transferase [Terracidiphilus sp.]
MKGQGTLTSRAKWIERCAYAMWLVAIAGFAALHGWHLRADFPNGSPWIFDWAKYTDEGWYGNAAVRAHLFGNWYVPGDFNPAVVVPVWPFVEWVLFFFTGVTVGAARGLAIACFCSSLALSYLLLRSRGPRWMALVGVTLVVTSPFLYCFSRLAILEPLQIMLTLAALNVAVRLPRMKRPVAASVCIGLLFALMVLTKTTAAFLAPAVGWAMVLPLWQRRGLVVRCALAAGCSAAVAYGAWMVLIGRAGLIGDFKYFFVANDYPKPAEFYWPVMALWWSFHGLLWIDHSLILLAGAMVLAAAMAWRTDWGRRLWRDPVFGAALWAVAGFLLFMTVQNHPQARYFAVPAFFLFFVVALGAAELIRQAGWTRALGWAVVAVAVAAAGVHGAQTIRYAAHPEYTLVSAATKLTKYIDAHPNGKRLIVSVSGDEITLITHLPAVCDELGTEKLARKLAAYQPGWYASWNDFDPDILQALHTRFSLEQAATFKALDHSERDELVLFKLHPLPGGQVRDPGDPSLRDVLPEDRIDVPIE